MKGKDIKKEGERVGGERKRERTRDDLVHIGATKVTLENCFLKTVFTLVRNRLTDPLLLPPKGQPWRNLSKAFLWGATSGAVNFRGLSQLRKKGKEGGCPRVVTKWPGRGRLAGAREK